MTRNRSRQNRGMIFQIILIVCLFAFFIFYIVPEIRYSNINKVVTVEAGAALPEAGRFLKNPSKGAQYAVDTSNIDMNSPGTHDLKIKSGNSTFKVKLEIRDTIPPTAIVKNLDLYEAREIMAMEFIESINDATNVGVSFKTAPDLNLIGNQQIILLLQDAAGNKSELNAQLRISKVKEQVRVGMQDTGLDIKSFLKEEKDLSTASIVEPAGIPDEIGIYPVKISIGDTIYESSVEVADMVAPRASAVSKKIWNGEEIAAADMVTDIVDDTEVTVSFERPPDYSIIGDQTVGILLTDKGGNQTRLEAVLTIQKDNDPPAIYGAKNTTVYIGNPVSYKKGVYAVDNRDGEVAIKVDSSNVNLKVPGEYKVVYSATDSSGNTSSKEIVCTVKELTVTMDELNRMADEILARITTEDMTLREKAWEIYQYVNKHLTYTGVSDKSDWMKEAYNGITKAVGDCFTYFSMSELLLNRIGMQTMRVERLTKPGEAKHYWHMVNYGEGWYHFDACIHKPPLVSFMLTDAELDAYSRRVGKDNYYYRYDRENYPRTPEK